MNTPADADTKPERLGLQSEDIAENRRHELLNLFPEARTEGGKLDFERLKLALGETVDVGRERYGMNWPGKADCFRTIQAPSLGTLLPVPEESIEFDSTKNLIIEGDNLEVLKLLQKSYLGEVKMIYIDPPYNTGNDFIYPDDYSESLQTYLNYTGQVDAEGRKFGTNTDVDGRFHSKWLNMMYPRMYLARNLLREDGVVFVSIDDHEMQNLIKIMDEVFGEENFVAALAVQLNPRGRHLDSFVAKTHEYVLIYAKDALVETTMRGIPKEGRMLDEYDREDEGGRYREIGLRNRNQAFNPVTRPTLFFPLYVDPLAGLVSVERDATYNEEVLPATADGVQTCWTWSRAKVAEESGLLTARRMADGTWRIFRKDYLTSSDGTDATTLPKSIWTDKDINNDYGKRAMQDLFGEAIMDFPKAPALIRKLVGIGSASDQIVLDFFAGSGTTGQAVLEANAEDGGNRRFILVQLPEPTDRTDYPTVSAITRERVRRVIERLKAEAVEKLDIERDRDLGFRAFGLDESNFKAWKADDAKSAGGLIEQLELHVEHIRAGRTEDDLLYEVLLKSGYSLATQVEPMLLADGTVYSVADGQLLVCLEQTLTLELIRAIAELTPERVVCLDAGFAGNDQLKTNAVQIFKTKAVTSFKTI
jgi:adenine-specific DNA-methyltransferase